MCLVLRSEYRGILYSLRNTRYILEVSSMVNFYFHSTILRLILLWNSLPSDQRNLRSGQLKNAFKLRTREIHVVQPDIRNQNTTFRRKSIYCDRGCRVLSRFRKITVYK